MGEVKRYKVLTGMDYDGKRVEPGKVVDDLPDRAVRDLLAIGAIELVKAKAKAGDKE